MIFLRYVTVVLAWTCANAEISSPPPFRSDYTFIGNTDSYYAVKNSLTLDRDYWIDANTSCALDGATLFVPENRFEADLVMTFYLNKTEIFYMRPDKIWIGLSDIDHKGNFTAIDGRSISKVYDEWAKNYPQSNNTENCAYLDRSGVLKDMQCNESLPFVCKKSVVQLKKDNPTKYNHFRKDFTFLENTKSFYKFHSLASWLEANETCATENAELYYPRNRFEEHIVLKYYRFPFAYDDIWMGMYFSMDNYQYQTITGESISSIHHIWLEDNPERSDVRRCVHMQKNSGKIVNGDCNMRRHFICRRSLASWEKESKILEKGDREKVPNFRDYVYVDQTRSYYKYSSNKKKWFEANDTCTSDGTRLFVAENKFETDFILNLFNLTQKYLAWIGITDIAEEGNYFTVDGRPVSSVYHDWASGLPMGGDQLNCVDLTYTGTITDARCDSDLDFICKITLSSVKSKKELEQPINNNQNDTITVSHPPPFNSDYTFIRNTESYYMVRDSLTLASQKWIDANASCALDGATLFIPENRFEVDIVMQFYLNRSSTYYMGPQKFWIGLSDIGHGGNFTTIDGRSISKVYDEWAPDYPKSNHTENCVYLEKPGVLKDSKCDEYIPVVCKKSVVQLKKDKPTQYNHFRKDFTFLEGSKSFYKFYSLATWLEANKTCASEKAVLYYPQNRFEDHLVLNFYRYQFAYNDIWMGVYYSSSKDQYETIDGNPISTIHHTWFNGEPKQPKENKCVFKQESSDKISNDHCNTQRYFICRKSLASWKKESNALAKSVKADSEVVPKFRDDYVYVDETRSYYRYSDKDASWFKSNETCMSEGAQLFVPENKFESDFVLNFFNLTQKYAAWIGITDIAEEGNYVTVDGRSISSVYNLWKFDNPTGSTELNCVDLSYIGTISDARCDAELDFICKKSLPPKNITEKIQDIPKFRSDYVFIRNTNSFYRIKNQPLFGREPWADANATCAADGATLFIPENRHEAHVVMHYYLNFTYYMYMPPERFWIGVSDIGNKGEFKTSDGRPFDVVYDEWSKNKPDLKYSENCVYLDKSGVLMDYDCNERLPIVCKKSLAQLKRDEPFQLKKFRSDFTLVKQSNSFYKFHSLATWFEANETCNYEDSELYYPRDKFELHLVLNLYHFHFAYNEVWAGVYYSSDAEIYQTVDGKPISSTPFVWHNDGPEQSTNKTCAYIHSITNKLQNDYCDKRRFFVCRKTLESLKNDNTELDNGVREPVPPFRDDYVYSERTRSYYKYAWRKSLEWEEANQACFSEGALLFIPEDKVEADFVINFVDLTQHFGSWLGIHDIEGEGVFVTVDGRNVSSVYHDWSGGHPGETGSHNCVWLHSTGMICGGLCEASLSFICKKTVDSIIRDANVTTNKTEMSIISNV